MEQCGANKELQGEQILCEWKADQKIKESITHQHYYNYDANTKDIDRKLEIETENAMKVEWNNMFLTGEIHGSYLD